MGMWSTIAAVGQGVSAVAGILDVFSGDDPQGPNPEVTTFNFFQQRVNAAEQVRQLGWQAWMSGRQAEQHTAEAGVTRLQERDFLDTAALHDDMAEHTALQAGHTRDRAGDMRAQAGVTATRADDARALAVHTRNEAGGMRDRSGMLFGRAQTLGGVLGRELDRGYTAANAAFDRTSAMVSADAKTARIQSKAAGAAAAAVIARAQVAIERATVKARRNISSLHLSAAQGGLASSSFTESGTAAIEHELSLVSREQQAVMAGARARAGAAAAMVGVTDERGAAQIEHAVTTHGMAMGAAADRFTRGQLQLDDITQQARDWGTRAAGADLAAGRHETTAAGLDVRSGMETTAARGLDLDAGRQDLGARGQTLAGNRARTAGAGARVRAGGSDLAATGAGIQQDFFSTQAEIGGHFLTQQPGVEEYGGQESILERMQGGGGQAPGATAPAQSEGQLRRSSSAHGRPAPGAERRAGHRDRRT